MFSDNWEKAHKKAADPRMVLNGNPLRENPDDKEKFVSHNMKRLRKDADEWSNPLTGHIYRAIRGMTLDRGE